ncbi:MAG: helix-turn-helix domain-containing protein [Bacteriovoracaceae bacterium]|nr:helix-turn-helix domain-containing protein [Bacteriovoracaceae bacterium]
MSNTASTFYSEKIKNILVTTRKKKNLTQIEMAKIAGVSQSKISKFENGTLELSAAELLQCLKGLGVNSATKQVFGLIQDSKK